MTDKVPIRIRGSLVWDEIEFEGGHDLSLEMEPSDLKDMLLQAINDTTESAVREAMNETVNHITRAYTRRALHAMLTEMYSVWPDDHPDRPLIKSLIYAFERKDLS